MNSSEKLEPQICTCLYVGRQQSLFCSQVTLQSIEHLAPSHDNLSFDKSKKEEKADTKRQYGKN